MKSTELLLRFVLDTIHNTQSPVDALSELETVCRVLLRLVDNLREYTADEAIRAILGGDADAE